jgi:DNA-binding IclR family transcriptional regulator
MASTTNGEMAPSGEHRTAARTMSILENVLASSPHGLKLGEVAESIQAPKSSVHGLAKGLVTIGYLREENGRYLPGPAIAHFLAARSSVLPAAYHHALEQLSTQWGETAMLGVLVGDSVVYIDKVASRFLVRADIPLHVRRPLWPGSSGKCFLAFMDAHHSEAYLRRSNLAPSEAEHARAELEKIRRNGFAINDGAVDPEFIGIASPVILGQAPVEISIAMGGPSVRVRDHLHEMTQSVVEMAKVMATRTVP